MGLHHHSQRRRKTKDIPRHRNRQQASVRRIAISSGSQIAATVASGVITIFVIRILTSRLGAEGYGQYIILMSFVAGASLIVDMGLNGVTYRDLARDPDAAGRILGTNLGLRLGLCIGAVPLVILLIYELYPSQRSALMTAGVILSFDIILTVSQTTLLSFYGSKVRGEVTAAIVLLGRCLFLATVVLTSLATRGLNGVAIAYVSADAVTAILTIYLVHRAARIVIRLEPRAWWAQAKRAAPLGLMQLANTLYLYVDSIMLSLLASNRAVAYYALGFGIITVVGSFSNMFASSLVPGLAVATPQVAKETIDKALYAVFCFSIPLGIGGVVLARNVVLLLGGPQFHNAIIPFTLLSLSLIVTFPGTVLSYAAVSVNKYRRIVGVTLAVLLSNVILNAILIPIASAIGASIALLVCETISTIAIYVVFGRYLSHYPRLQSTWRPVVAGVGMLLVGLGCEMWIKGDGISQLVEKSLIIVATYGLLLTIVRGIPDELHMILGRRRAQIPMAFDPYSSADIEP